MNEKDFLILACMFLVCFIAALAAGCKSNGGITAAAWDDASLAAKQAAVIKSQRNTLDDIGAAVGEIRDGLERARRDLERGVERNKDLASQWREIDKFVRSVIEAERKLEELERGNGGADAGAR
ncbi:MAG: hypothetical protein Pg6C_06160 [Treponemataceae bacterium]|nr:MAG: hypothetical protein Pg6C_06160 [Treponemataceae bacterium]